MSNSLPAELSKVEQGKRKRDRLESEAAALGVDVDQYLADVTKPDARAESEPVSEYRSMYVVSPLDLGSLLGHLEYVQHLLAVKADSDAYSGWQRVDLHRASEKIRFVISELDNLDCRDILVECDHA